MEIRKGEFQSHSASAGLPDRNSLLRGIAALIDHASKEEFPQILNEFLKQAVNAWTVCLLEFTRDAQPKLLFNAVELEFDTDFAIYLGGAYLIDPWYGYFLKDCRPAFLSIEDFASGGVEWQDYKETFYSELRSSDEAGYVFTLPNGVGIHLAFFRHENDPPFEDEAIALLRDLIPVMKSTLTAYFATLAENTPDEASWRRAEHNRVKQTLENFGADILTAREREVVQYLLRGYSAKDAARELGISPGTVNIHRTNIYEKLGVNTQGGVLAIFMDSLLEGRVEAHPASD